MPHVSVIGLNANVWDVIPTRRQIAAVSMREFRPQRRESNADESYIRDLSLGMLAKRQTVKPLSKRVNSGLQIYITTL